MKNQSKLKTLLKKTLFVAMMILLINQPGLAISIEDYRTHCGTLDGRETLWSMLPAESQNDIEQQAIGSGLDVEKYIVKKMEMNCSFYAPGTVVMDESVQSWSFSWSPYEPAEGEEIRRYRLTEDPPRCGPRCEGNFVLELEKPMKESWQACRVSYITNYHSDGPNRFHKNATASLEVLPDQWIDGNRFNAFKFKLIAHSRSYIELKNIEYDFVPADMSESRRRELGCIVPDRNYVERTGQVECKEDRSGIRHSDKCTVLHRAVGARRHIQHPAMRKAFISKPNGDTGEEKVVVRVRIGAPKTYTIRPGERAVLFSPPKYTDDRPVSIEITTQKVGADGISRYLLESEWNKI